MAVDRCYRILELEPGTPSDQVKDAYYRAAKKNHPDLFPEQKRHAQQLRMMKINEAYLTIVSHTSEGGLRSSSVSSAATGEVSRLEPGPGKAVGPLKDPAYTYYKLGFSYYSAGRKAFLTGTNRKATGSTIWWIIKRYFY